VLTSDPKGGSLRSDANPTNTDERIALLQGTLDLLILKTLVLGACHGQGIARSIKRQSEEVFFVDHGSLYLALQRLEDKKFVSAKWGSSENNRRARFYSLTLKGRAQLVEKTTEWQRLARAMGLILGSSGSASGEEA
jgi:PadR family transcriptional regulator, regulatory protein PadR